VPQWLILNPRPHQQQCPSARSVAEKAVDRKCLKYTKLSAAYEFQLVAVKSPGPMRDATASFLSDLCLGRKFSERSGYPLDVQFVFQVQRVNVLIQRLNPIYSTIGSIHGHSSPFLFLHFWL